MALNNTNFNCGINPFNSNMNNNMNMDMNMNMNNINNLNNMNNSPMNPMNSNININNLNEYFYLNFPPNSILNQQQNFDNFGGQLNQLNLMPNYNNINILNNTPIKNLNSDEINQNINKIDTNEEIEINFSFINSFIFEVKARPNEILKDVIYRFRIMECPKELKNSLSYGLFHASKVDQNKTIKELGIKNGEKILFVEKPNEKKEEFIYTERENEQLNKLRTEYKEQFMIKIKNVDNNKDNNGNETNKEEKNEPIPNFNKFIWSIDKFIGITVNEHNHKLVYCLTNVKWKCNNCNIKYKKETGKYYCSLCDYSMCESCHYTKKYFMKKSFPKGAKPSHESVKVHFFEAAYHQHRLAFCRVSRHFNYYSKWICKNCLEEYDNDQWSFYCTLCNFYLCCQCCGFQ